MSLFPTLEAALDAEEGEGELGEALLADLEEAAGRRGARRILRRARQDGAPGAPALPLGAWAPLEAWAHFRLWRHGRALAAAERARAASERARAQIGASAASGAAEPTALDPRVLCLWVEALDAISGLALRQGYLRHAERAGRLGAQFASRASPPLAERQEAARTLAALETFVGRHRDHGLPASLLRYLARSLGHPGGDSEAAAREVARDLSVTPEHLALARGLAAIEGLAPAVSERLQRIEEQGFRGHWRARRVLQRLAMLFFLGLLIGLLVLGLTLLQHRLR